MHRSDKLYYLEALHRIGCSLFLYEKAVVVAKEKCKILKGENSDAVVSTD